jgi:hypothetical protein
MCGGRLGEKVPGIEGMILGIMVSVKLPNGIGSNQMTGKTTSQGSMSRLTFRCGVWICGTRDTNTGGGGPCGKRKRKVGRQRFPDTFFLWVAGTFFAASIGQVESLKSQHKSVKATFFIKSRCKRETLSITKAMTIAKTDRAKARLVKPDVDNKTKRRRRKARR